MLIIFFLKILSVIKSGLPGMKLWEKKLVRPIGQQLYVCFVTRQLKGNHFLVFNMNFCLYVLSLFFCFVFSFNSHFTLMMKWVLCLKHEVGPCRFSTLWSPLHWVTFCCEISFEICALDFWLICSDPSLPFVGPTSPRNYPLCILKHLIQTFHLVYGSNLVLL